MATPPRADASHVVVATARRLAADALAVETLGALRARGIRPILLKGPATTRWLYGEDQPRLYRDVDLLVSPAQFGAAERVLADLGLRYHLAAVVPDEQVPHARRWIREGQTASIDLHHTLPGVGVDAQRTWDVLSEGTEGCDVGGVEAETLSEAGRALLLALHAASHGIRASQPLADLELALQRLDASVWEDASALSRRLGCQAAFAAGLLLLPRGAEVASRTGVPERLPVEIVLRASSPPDTAFGFERLAAARGPRAKVRLIGREVVPTRSFMRAWSPLAGKGRLGLALAYLWRPVWLLSHARAGLNAWRRAVRDAR